MKQQVQKLLLTTFTSDTATIHQATNRLKQLAKNNGFCMLLMEIIDDPLNSRDLKLAALVHLKLNIDNRWRNPSGDLASIDNQQRIRIKKSIVIAITRCAKDIALIKAYTNIIRIIVGYDYENWTAQTQIKAKFAANQDLSATMYCMLGVCTNFEFSILDKQKKVYYNFLRSLLPQVLKIIKSNFSNNQLIYLGLKILWKVVHHQIPLDIRMLTNSWMELVLLTISAYNDQYQRKIQNYEKYTPQFYYYHSKKWATRILLRFVQKHAKQAAYGISTSNQNLQYSRSWHQTYGPQFIQSIVQQMPIPTIKKVRFFQFKVVQAFIIEKPKLIIQYAQSFQENFLLSDMSLKQQDQTRAKQEPIQFLKDQAQHPYDFTNLKNAAMDLWVGFMQLGSKTDRVYNRNQPGVLFQSSFNIITSKMAHHPLSKQVAMRIFCKIKAIIIKNSEKRLLIPQIIKSFIISDLKSPVMLLRVRANQVFGLYGQEQLDQASICQASQGILSCLFNEQFTIVKIKAISALKALSAHPESHQFIKPNLQKILEIYLKLIKTYDIQQIVISLEAVIKVFSTQICQYTVQLFKYLSQYFENIIERSSQTDQYDHEAQMTALGILGTMGRIIEAPLDSKTRTLLQKQILHICSYIFKTTISSYIEQIMYILSCHIHKSQRISQQCWFFFQAIIYFLIGMPVQLLNQIQKVPISIKNKQILKNIGRASEYNLDYAQHAYPSLRNFVTKGVPIIQNQSQQKKLSFLQLLFYLIGQIYTRYSQQRYPLNQIPLSCASNLLINLIQNSSNQFIQNPESTLLGIWSFIKFNTFRSKTLYLKLVNLQLIGVCLWRITDSFIRLAINNNEIQTILNQIFNFYNRLQEVHERKRLILGISMLLGKWQYLQQSQKMSNIPELFKILLRLLIKNCKMRKIKAFEKNNMKNYQQRTITQLNTIIQSYYSNPIQQPLEYHTVQDDDEESWEENYQLTYSSKLSQYDQIQQFKKVMAFLQNQSSSFYTQLIKLVPAQNLNQVKIEMEEALSIDTWIQQNGMKQ